MGMSKSLLFCNRQTIFEDADFFCPFFIHLIIFVTTILSDLFDIGIIKTLVVTSLTTLCFNKEY